MGYWLGRSIGKRALCVNNESPDVSHLATERAGVVTFQLRERAPQLYSDPLFKFLAKQI